MGIFATRARLRRTVKTDDLTQRQAEVLTFMLQCWADGYLPTVRAICERFGVSSTNSAFQYISALAKKGYVKRRNPYGYQLAAKALQLAL